MSLSYLKDPEAIYAASFAAIGEEVDFTGLPEDLVPVATRLIHACGMIDLIDDLSYCPQVAQAARAALTKGAHVVVDCEMVKSGITKKFLPRNNEVICTLNQDNVPELAQILGTTRSAAAVDLWAPYLDDAIVVIGNAPTALFRLLELLEQGGPKPAAILGFPVGFVGAAESKAALAENSFNVPFICLQGRRGGSAMASGAFNAIAIEATKS
jgi:precorrin isomerase